MWPARRTASGPLCKEAVIRPSCDSLAFCAVLLLAGCAAPKKANEPKPKDNPLLNQEITVHSPNGEATVRSNGKLVYHIKWKDGTVAVGSEGPLQGAMEGVSGELYDDKGVPAPFRGDQAVAVKATKLLTITGNVKVHSNSQNATIACDRLEWVQGAELIKAKGNVVASGKFGELGPAAEMWSTSDFSMISTPAMWDPKLIPPKPESKAKKP
jgi:hypothetical protein